ELLSRLAAHLSATLPAIEVDALAYTKSELDLGTFALHCAMQGYERGRRVFFALEGTEPMAALVAENGGEGVTVSGLLTTCRFFAMSGTVERQQEAQRLLLDQAIEHYRTLEKREFLLLDDRPDVDQRVLSMGFALASPGVRWLVRRDVVPA